MDNLYKSDKIIKNDIKLLKNAIIWYKKDLLRNHVPIIKERMEISLIVLERKLNTLERFL